MNNNDYHTRAWSHHILLEYRAERQKQAEAAHQEVEILYETFHDALLGHPIFFNQACGYHSAHALLDAHTSEDYRRRWLYFCAPDVGKLPHRAYLQQLLGDKAHLCQHQTGLNTPRLVMFTAAFLVVAILAAQGNIGLALVVVAAIMWFWRYTEGNIWRGQQRLTVHEGHVHATHTQYANLQAQLADLPPPAPPDELDWEYQTAAEQLLRHTLLRQVPAAELGDLAQCLHRRRYQAFALESWGLLQLPLQAPPPLHALLLDENQPSLLAFQPASEQGQAVYRVTYLQIWVLTERGVLLGNGYYDRVSGQFLHLQQDFHPYAQLLHCRFSEQVLPELPALQARLPETVYRRYFRQPVPVMRLALAGGEQLACAGLPAHETHSSHFMALEALELSTDLARLNRLLHERMQGVRALAAA